MTKKLLWIGGTILALVVGGAVCLIGAFIWDMEKGEKHQRQIREDIRSGKWDFGDQPALFAVAQAIVKNDQDAIRAAAKALPDLEAPGRDGTTLLYFAVTQSWQRPELVGAVKTLLSLGVDPNYTNGKKDSLAMAESVHGSAALLRSMLDAGGNPNTRSEFGWPIVFMHFKLGYYQNEERARLDMLLDRGADINATVPETESESAGYSLVLYTTQEGLHDAHEYDNALHLLERGADPNRAGTDGMTLAKMLIDHRTQLGRSGKPMPAEFSALWAWAEKHAIVPAAQ